MLSSSFPEIGNQPADNQGGNCDDDAHPTIHRMGFWRVQNGELDGINPKVVVLLIGTNNIALGHDDASLTTLGILHLAGIIQQKLPDSKILILGLLPRSDQYAAEARKCNEGLTGLKDEHAEYFNPGVQLTDEDFADGVHLSPAGFEHMAKLLAPKIAELYGAGSTTSR
ncbi:MAG TPA: GDSL-type esterase/lipase family protein [Tepidisphaeraceae bacterium]